MSATTSQVTWELFEVGPYGNLCPAANRQSLLTIVEEDGIQFAAVLDRDVAHLIAAAPDLLAALKRCRFDSLNMSLEDLEFCRAAVAKAEGGAA